MCFIFHFFTQYLHRSLPVFIFSICLFYVKPLEHAISFESSLSCITVMKGAIDAMEINSQCSSSFYSYNEYYCHTHSTVVIWNKDLIYLILVKKIENVISM